MTDLNELDEKALAAAALAGSVGALMERMVDLTDGNRQGIADAMGVTGGRLSQIVNGDGNVRIATLGRLAAACGFELSLKALREDGVEVVEPRPARVRIPAVPDNVLEFKRYWTAPPEGAASVQVPATPNVELSNRFDVAL